MLFEICLRWSSAAVIAVRLVVAVVVTVTVSSNCSDVIDAYVSAQQDVVGLRLGGRFSARVLNFTNISRLFPLLSSRRLRFMDYVCTACCAEKERSTAASLAICNGHERV